MRTRRPTRTHSTEGVSERGSGPMQGCTLVGEPGSGAAESRFHRLGGDRFSRLFPIPAIQRNSQITMSYRITDILYPLSGDAGLCAELEVRLNRNVIQPRFS